MGPRGVYKDDALVEGPRLGLEACGAFYDLAAQVLHSGPATAGHYVARVLRQGLWWTCDDANVRSCPRRRWEVPSED
jgi:ubiquitin C-terminal hydrolase